MTDNKVSNDKDSQIEVEMEVEVEDPYVIVDCCNYIINMDKQGYYVLQKGDDELIWCQDCFYSDLWIEMKKKGWTCDDDSQDCDDENNSGSELTLNLDDEND